MDKFIYDIRFGIYGAILGMIVHFFLFGVIGTGFIVGLLINIVITLILFPFILKLDNKYVKRKR